nr:hypothetical protein CFP56_74587 [Quercus suber]
MCCSVEMLPVIVSLPSLLHTSRYIPSCRLPENDSQPPSIQPVTLSKALNPPRTSASSSSRLALEFRSPYRRACEAIRESASRQARQTPGQHTSLHDHETPSTTETMTLDTLTLRHMGIYMQCMGSCRMLDATFEINFSCMNVGATFEINFWTPVRLRRPSHDTAVFRSSCTVLIIHKLSAARQDHVKRFAEEKRHSKMHEKSKWRSQNACSDSARIVRAEEKLEGWI